MEVECDKSGAIRILLIDDNQDFLDSAERFLETDPAFCVVGKALSGDRGLEMSRELSPDVVLIDLIMSHTNGIDATRHIKMGQNPPLVIMLTLHEVEVYRLLARAAGADAYITKDNMGTQIMALIQNLTQGVR